MGTSDSSKILVIAMAGVLITLLMVRGISYARETTKDTVHAYETKYESKIVDGLFTKNIKTLGLEKELTGNIKGFSVGIVGSVSGGMNTDTKYHTYVEQGNGQYMIEGYNISQTYIKEIPKDQQPTVEELTPVVVIEKEAVKSISIISSRLYIDGIDTRRIEKTDELSGWGILPIDSLTNNQLELLYESFPELRGDEDDMVVYKKRYVDEWVMNVPEGTLIEDYNLGI